MSRARKHVLQSLNETPDLTPTQRICRVTDLRGDNIFQVQVDPNDEKDLILVLLPQKFHKLLWIKRGDFVVVDEFRDKEWPVHRGQVKGMIERILREDNIRELKKEGTFLWHQDKEDDAEDHDEDDSQDEDDLLDELARNPNRVAWSDDESESSEDS